MQPIDTGTDDPPRLPSGPAPEPRWSSATSAPVLCIQGRVTTGVVARPWLGWAVLAAGVLTLVGALGPWVEHGEATFHGGVLDGRRSAWAAVAMAVVGVLMIVGRGHRLVCAGGAAAAGIAVGYGATGYGAGGALFRSAPPSAWGVPLCVVAGAVGAALSLLGTVLRAPYVRTVDHPLRIRWVRPVQFARPEPATGGLLLVAGLLGVLGSVLPWTQELIPPDRNGLAGDGMLTVVTSAVVAGCGAAIVQARGPRWTPVLALACVAMTWGTSFLDYADVQHLTRGFELDGGSFYSANWGLHLVVWSSLAAVAPAVRAVAWRGQIHPATG